MKKLICMIIITVFALASCKGTSDRYIDADPEDVIKAVYEALDGSGVLDGYKTMLYDVTVNAENEDYFLGVRGVEYESAVASEPDIQPCAYSFVAVKLKEGVDYDAQRKLIEKNLNKSRWVCTSCEEALAVRYENYVAIIMCDKKAADAIETAYLNYMEENYGVR